MRFVLQEFEKIVCAVLFIGMTLIGFVNVVVRYATHYSFAASVLSVILSVMLLAASAWFSWATLMNQIDSGIRSYALGLPAWWYQIGLPFGFALIIIRYLQHAAETWHTPRQEPQATPSV